MIRYFLRRVKDKEIKEIKEFKTGSLVVVVNPSKEELELLKEKFDVYPDEVESGLDPNEIPRVEKQEDMLIIYTKYIHGNDLETLMIVIGKDFLMTISRKNPPFLDPLESRKADIITTQRYKTLLKFLDMLNSQFERKTLELARHINKWKSLKEITEKDLLNLLKDESLLMELVSAYQYIRLAYERLANLVRWYEDDKDLLEDIIVETRQGYEMSKSSLKAISSIREYYLIVLSNRLNRIITILTIFTIFIDVIAAISGIYGMNISLPLQKNPNAFWIILMIILAIWTGMLVYIRKAKIIQ